MFLLDILSHRMSAIAVINTSPYGGLYNVGYDVQHLRCALIPHARISVRRRNIRARKWDRITGGAMKLLALALLALPTVALATSVDFTSKGHRCRNGHAHRKRDGG